MENLSLPVIARVRHDDQDLLVRALQPYKPHCKYLKTMMVSTNGTVVSGRGELEIWESCYIDDTGHLNAVEVNICFNQMLYYLIAKCVQERLTTIFGRWTLDDYWARQLADILIARYRITFRSPINARHFFGEIFFARIVERRLSANGGPVIWIDAEFAYWDNDGGRCEGEAKVAIRSA
jgi:hypothetical protein